MIALIASFIVLAILTIAYLRKRPSNSPPIASVGIPFIGNYMEFASNPVQFIEKCVKIYGGVFTMPVLHKNLTFLVGPEPSTPFFKLNDDFMSQSEVYGFMTPVFGKGIVYDAEPKKRQQQMQAMSQALKSKSLKSYVPKIEKETKEYFKRWGEKGECDLLQALSELTILSSSRCLHGDDVREILFEDVARIYHDLDKGVSPLSFFFPYAPTAAHKSRDRAREEMVQIFSKVIAARRGPGVDNSERTDILQVFVDLEYKEGGRLSDDEIVGLLIALLFAGQHTSSITSTWTMMLLLHNKKCLEKVMSEQKSVLSANGDQLDADCISKMEYLQNSIKEALRLHPPLIMLMRMAMEDIEVTSNNKTFVVPKGDIVVTSPAAASKLSNVFPNPNEFIPERFQENVQQYAFLGFGAGMHACMGQQFGLLQVKTIMSILLRNYDIEPVDAELPEDDYTAMVVGPKNHCRVRYARRPDATF